MFGLIETDSYCKQAKARLHNGFFFGHCSLNHEQEQNKSHKVVDEDRLRFSQTAVRGEGGNSAFM